MIVLIDYATFMQCQNFSKWRSRNDFVSSKHDIYFKWIFCWHPISNRISDFLCRKPISFGFSLLGTFCYNTFASLFKKKYKLCYSAIFRFVYDLLLKVTIKRKSFKIREGSYIYNLHMYWIVYTQIWIDMHKIPSNSVHI